MPLDLQRLDQFDPFAVPTIRYVSGAGSSGGPGCTGSPPPCPAISHSSLCHELDAAGNDREQEDSRETEPKRRVRGELGWGRGTGGVLTACSHSYSAPQILQTTRRQAWHPMCGSSSSLWRRWSAPGGESCSGEAVRAGQGCSHLGDPEGDPLALRNCSFSVKLPTSPLCRPSRRLLRPHSQEPQQQAQSSPQGC